MRGHLNIVSLLWGFINKPGVPLLGYNAHHFLLGKEGINACGVKLCKYPNVGDVPFCKRFTQQNTVRIKYLNACGVLLKEEVCFI